MDSVPVLYLYDFILSISLKSSALFNNLLLLMCSIPFFACLLCSISFDTIYFPLATQSSAYCEGQLFLVEISAKEQSDFSTFFLLQLHIFHLCFYFCITPLSFTMKHFLVLWLTLGSRALLGKYLHSGVAPRWSHENLQILMRTTGGPRWTK